MADVRCFVYTLYTFTSASSRSLPARIIIVVSFFFFFFPLFTGQYGIFPPDHHHHHHHHHNHNQLTWAPRNYGEPMPGGAVLAGFDKGGVQLYAGRGFHDGHLLPAKINPHHSSAYVCLGGLEHAVRNYEVGSIIIVN